MIAKAATISHGSNAIRYSVNKDRADIVKTNLLPDDISPEAMFKRMMLVQKMFANERKRGRPLTDNVIRIEISPTAEESKGWTMDDWARLADEFIQEFDSIDLSKKDETCFFQADQPQRFAIRCRSTSGCKEWHSPPAH